MLFHKISSISRIDSAKALLDAQEKKEAKHKVVERFIQNMNMTANNEKEIINQKQTTGNNSNDNKYEFVRGRIINAENYDSDKLQNRSQNEKGPDMSGSNANAAANKTEDKPEDSVTIYRQLTSSKVVLDENGNKKDAASSSSTIGTTN